jgi:hypothetical protein
VGVLASALVSDILKAMLHRGLRRFGALAVVAGSLTACGGANRNAAQTASARAGQIHTPDWLPLEDNTVLDFETSVEGTGEKGRLVMQVSRPRGNRIELNVAGKIRRLEAKADGVAIATGGWLLREPFTVGATFQGLSGKVTIVGINLSLDVPSGHYTNCIETEEVTSTTSTRTTFCPGVGIAKLVIEGDVKGEPRREVAELKFKGPRIDLGPEKTTASPVAP